MKQAGAIANWAQPAYFVVLFICFLAAALAAVNLPGNSLLVLNGHTMGTRYRILLDSSSLASVAARSALQTAIDERLHQLDKGIFSTYESTSELSTLNQATVGEALVVSADLANVIESAKLIHEKSAGAFDVSLKPLVDLWGFGGTDTPREIPDKTRLEKALAKVGMNAVELQGDRGHFSVTRIKQWHLTFPRWPKAMLSINWPCCWNPAVCKTTWWKLAGRLSAGGSDRMVITGA